MPSASALERSRSLAFISYFSIYLTLILNISRPFLEPSLYVPAGSSTVYLAAVPFSNTASASVTVAPPSLAYCNSGTPEPFWAATNVSLKSCFAVNVIADFSFPSANDGLPSNLNDVVSVSLP